MDEMKRLSSCSSAPYSSLSSSTCFRSMVGPRPRMAGALPNTLCSLLLLRDFSSLGDAELLLWHFLAHSTHRVAVARLPMRPWWSAAPLWPSAHRSRAAFSARSPTPSCAPNGRLRHNLVSETLHPSRLHLFAPARTWCNHVLVNKRRERESSNLKNDTPPREDGSASSCSCSSKSGSMTLPKIASGDRKDTRDVDMWCVDPSMIRMVAPLKFSPSTSVALSLPSLSLLSPFRLAGAARSIRCFLVMSSF